MLTQQEADILLGLLKKLKKRYITFPSLGNELKLDVDSLNGDENFTINVNRKGKLKPNKCTYLTICHRSTILLRVDIEGPPHRNPDGLLIPCPHIHIYQEGFDDKWAFPLEQEIDADSNDLVDVLIKFLSYNNIQNIPLIETKMF
ncbi:hypothetical protein NSS79_25695 [Paenibacillus sp. FSL L8-0436]|uniref:DUF6978 family protein n=1 Tax=Paenibacillus sp. FSL L8-0436 TaxID=2954686 RepID=UPI0031587A8F